MMMKWCLMSSDVGWHIRDKLRPMPKHGSINLYVHGSQKALDGHLDSHTAPELWVTVLSWCFTSTEARWPITDGDRVGRGRQSEGSTAETAPKRPERPWTAARTMHCALCDLCTVQLLFQPLCLGRVTKTLSVAPLLTNNLDNSSKGSPAFLAQLHLPAHDLFWAKLRVQLHLLPLRSLDLLISPGTLGSWCFTLSCLLTYCYWGRKHLGHRVEVWGRNPN